MKNLPLLFIILLLQLEGVTQNRPNVIIIISDDHAYQAISAYGSQLAQTPHIDRLAKEGARFDNAFVTNSICGPSRAVILTGKYSHKNGFYDNENSRFDGSQNTFIKALGRQGYQTAWIGKWHLTSNPEGFSYWKILPGQGHYFNPDFLTMAGTRERQAGYATNLIQDEAEKWLQTIDPAKPFCLVVGHKATHRTWMPDTTDLGRFDSVTFPLPPTFYDNYEGRLAAARQDMTIEKTMRMNYDLKQFASDADWMKEGSMSRLDAAQLARYKQYYQPIYTDLQRRQLTGKALTEWKYQRYMQDYLATAISMDRNIGRLLDYLDKRQLTNNTLVMYVSDQGFYLGEHGWFDKRFMYEESFRTPLLMRWPGHIQPATINKTFVLNLDIAPTVLQATQTPVPSDIQGQSMLQPKVNRQYIYYHYYEDGEHAVSPHFGLRTSRYKLIRFYKKTNAWELYDLKNDRSELNNLYGKRGYKQLTSQLKRQLTSEIKRLEDTTALKILNQPLP